MEDMDQNTEKKPIRYFYEISSDFRVDLLLKDVSREGHEIWGLSSLLHVLGIHIYIPSPILKLNLSVSLSLSHTHTHAHTHIHTHTHTQSLTHR